ncbi:hypothetical protein H8D30_01430 [bacterium]|nr:hypothetical protein [bacterium]
MESVPYEMIEASCRADCGMPENLSPTDAILGSPTDDILGATNEPEVDYHRYFLSWEPCLNTLSNERGKEIVAALGDEQPLVLYRVHEDEVDAPHQIFLVQGRPLDGGGLARIGSITWPVSSEERTGEFLDSEDNQVATIERQGPTVVVQSEGSPPTTLVCGDLGTDSLTTFVPEGPAWIPLSGDIRLDFHYGYRRGEGEEWLRYLNEVSVTSLDGARQAELLLNYEGDIYLVSGKGGYEFHFPYEELNLEEANRVQAILTSKSGQRSRTLYIPYETYKTLVGGWLHPSIWGTLSSIDPEAVVNQ